MRTKLCLLLIPILLFITIRVNAQEYAFKNIPENLLKEANVIIRKIEQIFTVQNISKAVYKKKIAYTILNKTGDDYAELELYYDKNRTVSQIKATLFDAMGNEVRSLKKSQIKDESAISDISLFDDNRVKSISLVHSSYPYTVEFEYEYTYNGLFVYPSWNPQPYSLVSVQQASCKVVMPKEMTLRYREYHLDNFINSKEQGTEMPESTKNKTYVNKTEEDNKQVFVWEVANIPANKREPYSRDVRPAVFFAPKEFEYGGYKGDMSTWEAFGKWQNLVNKDRDDLSETTKNKIKEMTANIPDKAEKVRKVYEYLQNKTRYISIQLGIGGLQPFKSSFVDDKSYGDCKALSFYTQSLLKAIDIESYYTIVGAGSENKPFPKDFPSDYFNHIILCVPMPKDTIWLECTSQSEAFGYLGDFTGDRDVLLVTPQGGKLVHTPIYTKKDNLLHRKAAILINLDGNATADITTQYKALQEGIRDQVLEHPSDIQKKWLYEHIEIPNFDIKEFSLKRQKDRIPTTTEKLKLQITKLATGSGKRLSFTPNLMNKFERKLPEIAERKTDIYLDTYSDFKDVDTLIYTIPEKYKIESKPKDTQIETRFGKYQITIQEEGNKITYIRSFEMNRGTYPKDAYPELVKFFEQIAKSDKAKIVLVSTVE